MRVGLNAKEKVDERDGPFSVIENTIEGGLRFLSMTSLDVRASTIEMAFIRDAAHKRQIPLWCVTVEMFENNRFVAVNRSI